MRYRFGPFQLDPELPLLLRDGETVSISPRALAGLVLLVKGRHSAVGRRELMDALWPDAFVEEGSLDQLVSALRKVLTPGFPGENPIKTIPKIGYRFVAEVAEDVAVVAEIKAEAVAAALPETPVLPPEADVRPRRFGGWGWAVAAVLVVAVPAVPLGLRYRRVAVETHRHVQAARYTVAVLPFQDLSAHAESAWVSTATQETLSTDLRMSRSLRVTASEDVNRALAELHMTQTAEPAAAVLRRLGNELDCDHAVTGAYLLRDGQIRLDVRLVNLRTGATEHESSYDQPEKALLPMLSRVREQMASTWGIPMAADSVEAFADGMNPDAYRLFAEGVASTNRYEGKPATLKLKEAITLEPSFSLAHLALSTSWSQQGEEIKAAAEAEQALKLSGNLPREQQLVIQARVLCAQHKYGEAAELYRSLLRFYPDNPEYGRLLIQTLSQAGKNDEAVREMDAILAAPDSGSSHPANDPRMASVIADMYSTMGEWPKSLEWSRRGADESKRRGATILYERLLTTESQAEFHLGQNEAADAQTREALGLAREFEDVSGELRALNRLGQIAIARKDWATASESLTAALEKERNLDQKQREMHTLLTLSKLNEAKGDVAGAYRLSDRAVQMAEDVGIVEMIAEAKRQRDGVAVRLGSRRADKAQLALAALKTR